MKKYLRISLLTLSIVLIFGMYAISFAGNIHSTYGSATISGAGKSKIETIGGTIIGAIKVIATIIAIAALLMIGMKFMLSSPSEKANAKAMLIPYIVAVVLIFAAIPILSIIYNVVK